MARSKKNIGEKYNSPFAKTLRKLMDDTNTTQDMLSEKIDRTRQTVSQYVNGISEPGYDTLVKIADSFQVSLDYLLGRTEAKTLDISIQSAAQCTCLAEENIAFLANGKTQLRNNCPPFGVEDFFIINQDYQQYYRARGGLFLVNSLIEVLRNNPGICRRADKLYQYWSEDHNYDQSGDSNFVNEWMQLTAHRLTEEDFMRYVSNETAKAFDAYLVSKCLSAGKPESK